MFNQGRVTGYQHGAITISSRGKAQDAKTRIFGQRVIVPQFEIFSNPTVRISEVSRRRFNIIDRMPSNSRRYPIRVTSRGKASKHGLSLMNIAVQKARQQIMQQEDENIFKILDNIAATGIKK